MASEYTAYGLSELADAAEFKARQDPNKMYQYVPLAPGDSVPEEALDFSSLPGSRHPLAPTGQGPLPAAPIQNTQPRPLKWRPSLNVQTSANGVGHLPSPSYQQSTHQHPSMPLLPPPPPPPPQHFSQPGPNGTLLLPANVVSSGPGQAIAPAPPRPGQNVINIKPATFRHSPYSIPPPTGPPPATNSRVRSTSSPRPSTLGHGQKFVIHTPHPPHTQNGTTTWSTPGHRSSFSASSPVAGPSNSYSAGGVNPYTGLPSPIGPPNGNNNGYNSFSAGPNSAVTGPGGLGNGVNNPQQGHVPGQNKIPMQFINNTPESTKDKAARKMEKKRAEQDMRDRGGRDVGDQQQMGSASEERKGSTTSEGGQRVLLPKP
jgi:hypothetical protein